MPRWGIDIDGNAAGFTSAVAKIGPATKRATDDASGAIKGLERSINRSKEATASLGSALSVVSPEIGGIVTRVGALQGAGRAAATAAAELGVGLGTVAAVAGPAVLALGALYVIYKDMTREMELEAALHKTERAALESLAGSTRRLEDARIDLRIATGDLTEEEGRLLKVQHASQRAVLDFAKGQAGTREELRKTAESATFWGDAVGTALQLGGAGVLRGVADEYLGFGDKVKSSAAQLQVLDRALLKNAENEKALRLALEETGAAQKGRTGTAREQKLAEVDLAELVEARIKATRDLEALTESAYQATLPPLRAALRQQELEIANLSALAAASADESVAAQARYAVEARQEQELAALRERLDDEQRQRDAEATRRQIAEMETRISFASSTAGAVRGLSDLVVQSQGESALAAFEISKAAALAQIAIDTTLAGMRAYATSGPLGAATALIAGGVAAAQVASQEPPSWYTGSTEYASPQGTLFRGHPGETHLTRSESEAVGGREGVRRIIRDGSSTTVRVSVDGREIGNTVARGLRRGGPSSREIERHTGRQGHWSDDG